MLFVPSAQALIAAKALIAAGADTNARDEDGRLPLERGISVTADGGPHRGCLPIRRPWCARKQAEMMTHDVSGE